MDENGNWQDVDRRAQEEMMQVDEDALVDDPAHHHTEIVKEEEKEEGYVQFFDGDMDLKTKYSPLNCAPVSPFSRYLFTTPQRQRDISRISTRPPPSSSHLPDHHHSYDYHPNEQTLSMTLKDGEDGEEDLPEALTSLPLVKEPVFLLPRSSPSPPLSRVLPPSEESSLKPLSESHQSSTRHLKGILKKDGKSRSSEHSCCIDENEPDQAKMFYAKYEPREILGKGLCSTVRLAVDKTTHEEVAVKVIDVAEAAREQQVTMQKMREETRREIELLELCRKSRQSNVVQLKAHYETTAYIFLVFELCKEGDMFDFLNNGYHCSEKRTRHIMRQLLQVVDFLHSHRIVHRDLKLENILVSTPPASDRNKEPQTHIKVADFGFAAHIPQGKQLYERQGTLATMAPEVISATEQMGYDLPIDLWACGVIMYTLLCGFPPFWHRNRAAMIRDILSGRYCFRSPLWDDISDTPKDLISRLLVVDPRQRYTARQALNHPFFHTDIVSDKKVFKPRAVFRSASFAVRFYFRLRAMHERPAGLSQEMVLHCPYSLKEMRLMIDTTAFGMYGHWVKRGGNQNRALLFQHEKRG